MNVYDSFIHTHSELDTTQVIFTQECRIKPQYIHKTVWYLGVKRSVWSSMQESHNVLYQNIESNVFMIPIPQYPGNGEIQTEYRAIVEELTVGEKGFIQNNGTVPNFKFGGSYMTATICRTLQKCTLERLNSTVHNF